MNLLIVDKVTKSYTEKRLLQQITVGISEGDKIGVIGINGTGKTTLLKLIAGLEYPDEGSVIKGNKVKIEYLAQNPVFDENENILVNVIKGKTNERDHWNIEGEAKAMLQNLGLDDPLVKISTLSGGQKKRVALVRTLMSPADILVLDEPTNHLDNEMAEWLEEYLIKWQGAFIMVTHDRYFLDKVTNRIVEIENGNVFSYSANYMQFLELKAQREDIESATERKNKSLYRQDLEWMMRGAKARSTKQKAHIQRFEDLKNREKPAENANVELNSLSSRLGKKTIEIESIFKSYGDKKLIEDFTYIFLKNDRIGIVGHNGCGKSTLLKIINGIVEPDTGTVTIGETVKIGYFSQENEYMDESLKVIDLIRNIAEYIETVKGNVSASVMLERFLFNSTMQYSLIAKLSGGEKRRLYLLKVLMDAPNILILDEPTNDLDIQTLNILEDYLMDFDGIVITVSHDRYFLDKIVSRIFAFEGEGIIRQYEGGFSDYKAIHMAEIELLQKAAMQEEDSKPVRVKSKDTKLKFSYKEEKDYNEIDQAISLLEEKIVELDENILKESSNYSKLNELMNHKKKIEDELEIQMERWVYLNDLAEEIENEKNSL
jgi:ABC transport system ATP-binding/permease protein